MLHVNTAGSHRSEVNLAGNKIRVQGFKMDHAIVAEVMQRTELQCSKEQIRRVLGYTEQCLTVDRRMGRSLFGRSSRCFWQSRFWQESCHR